MDNKIRPGFILNCYNRTKNPLFESHDPSMMWDPVSKMYYSYATDAAITSEKKQGIPVRRSRDLIQFEVIGYALSDKAVAEGRDNGDYPPTADFWAPFVEYVPAVSPQEKGEFRMYYSATKAFGSSESRIWLAVSEKAEGPFENRGVVMDTWFTDDTLPNAIDAHIIDDADGKKYLVYGSFFGGIYIKELDKANGMPADGDARNLGKRIAKKPEGSNIDGPEGAAVLYHEGYYYLFVSYGWLGDDYDIRVGRSEHVLGPYLDFFGKDMNSESLGMKLAGSYQFTAENPWTLKSEEDWTFEGFRGPGHGVPFYDPVREAFFFVHHVRDGAKELRIEPKKAGDKVSYKMHYMVVRRMLFVGGWPVFSPEPYAGEATEIICENVHNDGHWEWLSFDPMNNTLVRFSRDRITDNLMPVKAAIFNCFDFENSCMAECFTGYSKDGVQIWGKRIAYEPGESC